MKITKLFGILMVCCLLGVIISFIGVMAGNLVFGAGSSIFSNPFWYAIWICFAGFFIFLFAFFITSSMSDKKILTKGLEAEAKILTIHDTQSRTQKGPIIRFNLQVNPIGKPAFEAEVTKTISVVELPSYQPGKILFVRFDPETKETLIAGAKP